MFGLLHCVIHSFGLTPEHKEKKRRTQFSVTEGSDTSWFLHFSLLPWFLSKVKTIIRTYICTELKVSHSLPHPPKTMGGRTGIFLIPIAQMRRPGFLGLNVPSAHRAQEGEVRCELKPWDKEVLSPGCSPLWHPPNLDILMQAFLGNYPSRAPSFHKKGMFLATWGSGRTSFMVCQAGEVLLAYYPKGSTKAWSMIWGLLQSRIDTLHVFSGETHTAPERGEHRSG